MVRETVNTKKEVLISRLREYQQPVRCTECECENVEIGFHPLTIKYLSNGIAKKASMEFAAVTCGKCRRMMVFLSQPHCQSDSTAKGSRCRICGSESYRKAVSELPYAARGHEPGAYEVLVCEQCGGAYFFEIKRNFGTWGGFSYVEHMSKLTQEFRCSYCGEREGVASRTFFGTGLFGLGTGLFGGLALRGTFVISLCCKKCHYVQFHDDP